MVWSALADGCKDWALGNNHEQPSINQLHQPDVEDMEEPTHV